MTIQLPIEAIFILHILQSHGYESYVVGGALRDLLIESLHHEAQDLTKIDFDFTTNATPEQIQEIFPDNFYENTFGTVTITPEHLHELMAKMGWPVPVDDQEISLIEETNRVIKLAEATKIHESLTLPSHTPSLIKTPNFEITTYRSEGTYEDHRRPTSVSWGKTIDEDLSRRDFTINAMALRLTPEFTNKVDKSNKIIEVAPENYALIDLFDGLTDIKEHRIRTVGDPGERFQEDALRMLRAIRFSVQLNMQMTDEVFTAISALAADIQHVSWERIRDEFFKMLQSDFPAEAIELLEETGLLHYLLPELREGKGVEQGGHHTTDVWTHSIDALRCCPSSDPVVRFATLLHDIAKPATYRATDGKPTFYNHEIIGARVASKIAHRFRLSKRDIDRVFALVRYHMFYYQVHNTDAAIRRFMRKVGLENINDILDLREGDRLGSGARKTSWRLEEMKQRMIEQLHQPFAITDLAITGTDLMAEFGLKPGPEIGRILKALFELVLDQPELNTKENLLVEAKKLR